MNSNWKNFSLDWKSLFIGILILIGFCLLYLQEQELRADLQSTKNKLALLEVTMKQQRRSALSFQNVLPRTASPTALQDRLFKALYDINGNASSEDASVSKKIRYLPNELIIQDLSLIDEDPFFDLLGILMDDEAIKSVELPSLEQVDKSYKPMYRYIKKQLVEFGVPGEIFKNSVDQKFRIRVELKSAH